MSQKQNRTTIRNYFFGLLSTSLNEFIKQIGWTVYKLLTIKKPHNVDAVFYFLIEIR